MKRYYVEIEDNIIKNPANISGENIEEIEITEPFLEVTEEFYIQFKDLLPATYELDSEDNMINITPIPRPEPEPLQPTDIELLQQKVEQQDKVIQELMFEIIPSIAGGGM